MRQPAGLAVPHDRGLAHGPGPDPEHVAGLQPVPLQSGGVCVRCVARLDEPVTQVPRVDDGHGLARSMRPGYRRFQRAVGHAGADVADVAQPVPGPARIAAAVYEGEPRSSNRASSSARAASAAVGASVRS